jgi:threonine synthase
MSAQVVARAAMQGSGKVVATSSGNAGASLAAYAGAAGLRCTIISTRDISDIWAQAIEMTGAELVLTETSKGRWRIMRRMVEEEGWYPVVNYLDPPVGSNPFGVQGYKTVAYEIVEQCGGAWPTVIVVPTSRGDLLWGIWQGLLDCRQAGLLRELPRLVAAEPLPRLSKVLDGEDYRQPFSGESHGMTSIGGTTATYQSETALRGSQGGAVEVSTQEAREAQRALGRLGFYAELSSAAALAGLWELKKREQVGASDRVVLILTSHGYKEVPTKG